VPRQQIIGEPVGRNTAPAVALAAAVLLQRVGDVPFTVLPSDHLIAPGERFRATLLQALQLAAERDVLLTFGVRPDRPETGYGYIEAGAALAGHPQAMAVRAFTEKPDLPTAERWLAGGRHLWNSGMFAWRASVVLAGLRRHQPQAVLPMEEAAAAGAPGTDAFGSALERAYQQAPAISIDYALMERAENAAVLAADFQWNDVGHWLAMRTLWATDAQGNACYGRTVSVDSGDCIVYGPRRVTALVGVRDLVVVHTDDVLLVCDAKRAQDVRRVIDELERSGDQELL
jgi:mannose-1-phosphate guanylyltransferase/mannose-6-phosphate isomerase